MWRAGKGKCRGVLRHFTEAPEQICAFPLYHPASVHSYKDQTIETCTNLPVVSQETQVYPPLPNLILKCSLGDENMVSLCILSPAAFRTKRRMLTLRLQDKNTPFKLINILDLYVISSFLDVAREQRHI